MPHFFTSVCWHNEGRVNRTSRLRERRVTWTIDAACAADAVGYVRDWVLNRPNKPGRRRRIVFQCATEVGHG